MAIKAGAEQHVEGRQANTFFLYRYSSTWLTRALAKTEGRRQARPRPLFTWFFSSPPFSPLLTLSSRTRQRHEQSARVEGRNFTSRRTPWDNGISGKHHDDRCGRQIQMGRYANPFQLHITTGYLPPALFFLQDWLRAVANPKQVQHQRERA